ncbi:hypothetical protein IX330_002849 [Bacteroides pyogenes]|nr:hypothetical protein [Bacteroides pyogenes]
MNGRICDSDGKDIIFLQKPCHFHILFLLSRGIMEKIDDSECPIFSHRGNLRFYALGIL